ncbi:MAG: cbb3-type cytochrome c oxidase subunit I [Flavobacteriales bacterium]|nr:cbb3-type cytochrome c oxidase subunit I [Flavobacteriales bacterium]
MRKISFIFISLSLLALIVGAIFGTLAGIQYVKPDFLKDVITFNKMRPFHVSTVIGWIILCATGGIYYYLTNVLKLNLFSKKLAATHLSLFILCAIAIYISFATGKMGGREYFAYAPIISIPIFLGWILFGINYFKTTLTQVKNWPVYLWMWGTGIAFMMYHLAETNFWMIPYFRENFIKDITVQWKSYGSLAGCWNMLVYGTAIFLMSKIKNDENIARGKKTFFFYFLGLTNLMLGWAHHTYIVPTQPWVRYLAYGISMTEWVVLISIIIDWKHSLSQEKKEGNCMSYKFLMATDFWVFVNLIVALLISIPYINLFTHGTHITVAHSMGTTIGINTTILLASVFFISNRENSTYLAKHTKLLKVGYWIFNISLGIFWICLLLGGVEKSIWMYFTDNPSTFGEMQNKLQPYMYVFLAAGYGILIGILMVSMPLLSVLIKKKNT